MSQLYKYYAIVLDSNGYFDCIIEGISQDMIDLDTKNYCGKNPGSYVAFVFQGVMKP